ncbi:MAG: hypothetical protein A2Z11_00305 [Candidatus Woykebacteria bacterium RBG_16_43_9]|uniref:RNA polymerase alpha subunit C-terminal domain-containing protein n=1 Tax=Candidatus Woykebacteria bacterium RBG_16_43_9 TaxID=1802596 RepID=A0A1G1WG78_9BACT|nr:MAG: hypothetical protein A2Z11_00305 [Candidatus Woykebacteria bacterium RBG_16_43_9]
MTEEILIPCPNCGQDLKPDRDVGHSLVIYGSQVAMNYQIFSGVVVHCPTCRADVSEYLRSFVNGYSQLVSDTFSPTNVYGDIREFIRVMREAIAKLPEPTRGGKLSMIQALLLRYGLDGNKPLSLQKVSEAVGLTTEESVRQRLAEAFRRLRQFQISVPILEALNRGAQSNRVLQTKLAEADETIASLEGEVQKYRIEVELSRQRILHSGLEVREISDVMLLGIERLDLPLRGYNALARTTRGNCQTIGDVLSKSPKEILALRNFGVDSLRSLIAALRKIGIEVEEYWGKDLEKRYKL